MDYEYRFVVQDDASKTMGNIQTKMSDVLSIVKNLGSSVKQLPKALATTAKATDQVRGKTKGLLGDVHGLNRTLRRTTTLFGAAFGLSSIAAFTSQVIETEQGVANVMDVTGDELNKLSAQATKLSTVFGTDVNSSIETANTLSKQFGISANQSFSLIEKALGKGVSKDFLSSVEKLSPAFKQAGISAESTLSALINAERSGVGDSLLSAYQQGINNLQTLDGQGIKNALGAFGIDVKELKANLNSGKLTTAEAMKEIVARYKSMGSENVEAAGALKTIFGASALEAQDFIAQLGQVGTSLTDIKDRTTDGVKAQRYLLSTWAEFKVLIAENVVPILVSTVSWVKENQAAIVGWGSVGLKVIGVFTGIWAAAKLLMGLRAMVMTITAAYQFMTNILNLAKVAQIAFNIAVSLNPIGLVIAAIAALGAAIYLMINDWDTFKQWLWKIAMFLWKMNPLSWMVEFMEVIFPGFKQSIADVFNFIVEKAQAAFSWLSSNVIDPMKNKIQGVLDWLGVAESKTSSLEQKRSGKNEIGFTKSIVNEVLKPIKSLEGITPTGPKMTASKLSFNPNLKQPSRGFGLSAGIAGVQGNSAGAKNVTINIDRLIENMVFNTTNLQENTSKVRDEITKALMAAVNDANNI